MLILDVRTDPYCTVRGCLNGSTEKSDYYGYWTSSITNDGYAWTVVHEGVLQFLNVTLKNYRGVRPVITISKSLITK